MSNAATRLLRIAIERAENAPIAERIQIYRDAAEILASESDAALLVAMISELEAINSRHRQLFLALSAA